MKKILAMMLAAMTAVSLAACGGSPASSSAAPESSGAESSGAESSAAPESSEAPAGVVVSSVDDLKSLAIGVQAGTTGETYVSEDLGLTPESFKSGMDAALALKNSQIDAVVLDEQPAKSIVAQNDDLTIIDLGLEPEEYAIAVKKGNTELLDSINATIQKLRDDGTYETLVNTFMPADGSEPVVPEALPAGGDKPLILGTNAAFKPFEYVDGSEPIGFDITMGQYIAQDFGATLQVEDMAFDSLISALQSDKIDFIAAGMTATDERRQSVDFSEPYYSSKQVVIVKK
ncbi:MAG: transporter substrate-binding domain-containing protein [Oscillospiraceae bacterium]|nr:transporter substrate-binding domain-containing protein [Oscillospiraceae bacterium]MCI9669180.1 transporter substrate-binding domain-containing protein [Oscillospiraceae bacterium]